MSDFYTEHLIKRKATMGSLAAKVGLILLTIISIFFVFTSAFAILIPVILIVVDVILFKRMNVEFEYLYVNGELDIDKIMSKEKRKRIFSTDINSIEIVAPVGSPEVRSYQNVKIVDYSSQEAEHRRYEMIVLQKGQKLKVIIEPNDAILEGMRMLAPRKVFI